MKAKCLISTVWYTLTFEAGEVYDIDEMLYPRLIRTGKFQPYKETVKVIPEEPEVEQPEAPEALKPVATSKPLPKHKPKGKRK